MNFKKDILKENGGFQMKICVLHIENIGEDVLKCMRIRERL